MSESERIIGTEQQTPGSFAVGSGDGFGWRAALVVLSPAMVYATIRYQVFKGVAWSDWPTYTVNKALALSSLILFGLVLLRCCMSPRRTMAQLLSAAGLFGLVHVLISLTLFDPLYYETLYDAGKLRLNAGLAMLLGAVAFSLLLAGALQAGNGKQARTMNMAAIVVLVGLHAAFQGYESWLSPSAWPGKLFPISLLAFAVASISVTLFLFLRPRHDPGEADRVQEV